MAGRKSNNNRKIPKAAKIIRRIKQKQGKFRAEIPNQNSTKYLARKPIETQK